MNRAAKYMKKTNWFCTSSQCSHLLFHITAGAYVVRKIQASISEGEKLEKPILTPCSAKGKTLITNSNR